MSSRSSSLRGWSANISWACSRLTTSRTKGLSSRMMARMRSSMRSKSLDEIWSGVWKS